MNKTQILQRLKSEQDERGIQNWKKRHSGSGLTSYGIGLTRLRKIAKEIGRKHELAAQLWATDNYDAKTLGLLIDDPNAMSAEQAERMVDELHDGLFAHVFASCDAALAKTKFAQEVADRWMASDEPMRRRCGYTLLYELSKKKSKSLNDSYFMDHVATIDGKIDKEQMTIRCAMAGALLGVGKRNRELNRAAIKIAKRIGPVEFEQHDDQNCEPFDLLKHLTSDYLKKKLNL